MRIVYCVDKCFYICDVVVVRFLYITFLIHKEQFAFQAHAYKIWLLGNFGRMHGGSLVTSGSFCVLRHKADS